MQAYLAGQPVNLPVLLVDQDGLTITAQSVSYRVIDQNETELVAKVALSSFFEGDESVTVVIDGALNVLGLGVTRSMRVVELYLTTEIGTIKLESGYFVEADEVLVENQNSFQSYNAALFASCELPGVTNWSLASKQERIAALIAARRNVGQLRFRYVFDAYQNIIDNTVGVADLTLATAEQWAAMPAEFKAAICRAQVLEADFLLMPSDSVSAYRRDGLMSMTVGEAKQFFRPSKSIEGVVCKRAMKELSKYVLTRTRLTRG